MFKKLFFVLIGCCCVATMFASSVSKESEKENAPIGVRAESFENRMAKLETRAKLEAKYPEGMSDLVKASHTKKSIFSIKENNSKISYAVHPASYQIASFFYSAETHSIMTELTDGSQWFVNGSEFNAIHDWAVTDPVIITQNHAWISPFAFRLTNQRTGESLGISIYLGPIEPIYGSRLTHWITAIDDYNNIVYLEDGSIWYMSAFDKGTFTQWVPGDIVIIGVNDGWLFAYNPNMLINVATLDFAVGAAVF